MQSMFEQVLSEVEIELSRGYFKEAKAKCNSLFREYASDAQATLHVSVVYIRACMLSGFYIDAYEKASEIVNELGETVRINQDAGAFGVVKLQFALSGAMVHGRFEVGDLLVEEILPSLPKDIEIGQSSPTVSQYRSAFDTFKILQISYIAQYTLLRQTFKYPALAKTEGWLVICKEHLEYSLSYLCLEKRISEAYLLVKDLNNVSKANRPDRLLKMLDYAEHCSPAILAGIYYNLASLAVEARRNSLANHYIALAATYYNISNHAFGYKSCLELQLKLTSDYDHGVLVQSAAQNFHICRVLCKFYDQQEYVSQLFICLTEFAERARLVSNYKLYLLISSELSKMTRKSGSNLLVVNRRTNQISFFLTITGNTAKALECIDAMLPIVEKLKVPYLTGQAAAVAGLAYEELGRAGDAIRFSNLSLENWSYCGEDAISMAKYQLLRCYRLASRDSKYQDKKMTMSELIHLAREWAEVDIENQHFSQAVEKLLFLIDLHFENNEMTVAERMLDIQSTIQCIQTKLVPKLDYRTAKITIANTIQCRAHLGFLPGNERRREDTISDLERSLEKYVELKMWYHSANLRQMLGLLYLGKEQDHPEENLESLGLAINHLEIAYQAFEFMSQTSQCIGACYLILKCYYRVWVQRARYILSAGDKVLEILEKLSMWTEFRRAELSALGGINAILEKQALASDRRQIEMGEMALNVCRTQRRHSDAWNWVQRDKARSISDIMGLGVITSMEGMDTTGYPENLKAILAEYNSILANLRETSPADRIVLRGQLDNLVREMGAHPELDELVNVHLGQSITLAHAADLFIGSSSLQASGHPELVFVDWFVASGSLLYMLVLKKDLVPKIYVVGTISDVQKWTAEYFQNLDDLEETLDFDFDDEDSPFRKINYLILELVSCTAPGDILVFSPTNILHTLPLHALVLPSADGGTILIKRNPVVYTPSLTIFKQCILRARRPHEYKPAEVKIASVYEVEADSPNIAEQREIERSIRKVADRFKVQPLWGSSCTKQAMKEFVTGARLLHYHGHCKFDAENILNHSLILTRTSSGSEPGTSEKRKATVDTMISQETNSKRQRLHLLGAKDSNNSLASDLPLQTTDSSLTVAEIFDLTLANPVVTMIACESASQKIVAGDEPLGIATAFLCAGASSYIGTIWEMPSREGRVFTAEFYDAMEKQEGDIINLAEALQKAVIKLMNNPNSRNYRYWAPLVLQGSWFCQSSIIHRNLSTREDS